MRYDLADVFTDRPLAGNQLAVFGVGRPTGNALMQAVALEMNLAETVFLAAARDGGDIRARLWTTAGEVDFAGHPLLGTAAVLADRRPHDEAFWRIETNVGTVPVTTRRTGPGRYTAWMDQPLPKTALADDDLAGPLLDALGLPGSVLPVTVYDAGLAHLYIMCDDPGTVRGIVPDYPALGRIVGHDLCVNVFARTGEATVVTRMFSPFDKVPEDPACGSAAGPLAAHLVRHGLVPSGTELTLSQGEAVDRPSTLYAVAKADADGIRSIRVGGGVCLIGGGHLNLPADLFEDAPAAG